MSFLVIQILVCLLLAGLIGGVIGWFLRGGCDRQLQEQKEECEMKMRAVEREWNTKLNYPDEQKLSDIADDEISIEPTTAEADLKNEVKVEMDPKKNTSLFSTVATTLGVSGTQETAPEIEVPQKPKLSDEKIQLFKAVGIDIDNSHDLEDDYDIEMIPGVNTKYAKRFHELEIYTTNDLLKKIGKNYSDIDDIAQKLKVQSEDVTSWISMADILRLPKLNPKNAQLLQNSGITSVRDLSAVNTFSLHKEVHNTNEKLHIVDAVPDIETLELWSKVSRILG